MLVGVSNKLYLIIIISRFIHISSGVMCQCWYPLILVLSCFRRQASLYQQLNWGTCFTPVNFHFLLYMDGNPDNVNSLGLRDRIPSENVLHSSWKLSFVSRDRPVDGGRQHCDMLRNARAVLANCSRNDVMTSTLCGASFRCRMLSHRVI